jgi:RNA polymerase sigma-70 factor (ECF subfamily)
MRGKPEPEAGRETRHDADYCTSEEFVVAMRTLEPPEIKRLTLQGRALALGGPMSGDDLLSEAIRLTADGGRRWPRDVTIGAYLYMTMKGVASNARRRDAQLVHVPLGGDTDGAGDRLSGIADTAASPEARAIFADIETRAFAALDGDDEAQWLLLSRLEGESMAAFRQRHGLSNTEFEAVSKRLQRKLRALKTEA